MPGHPLATHTRGNYLSMTFVLKSAARVMEAVFCHFAFSETSEMHCISYLPEPEGRSNASRYSVNKFVFSLGSLIWTKACSWPILGYTDWPSKWRQNLIGFRLEALQTPMSGNMVVGVLKFQFRLSFRG